ncbi:hypothetical protein [Nostoc sp. JL33]|nr:hypothetical protein [Nostoc sp. JL33]
MKNQLIHYFACDRTFSNSGKELANSLHGQSSTSTNVNFIYKSE